MNKYTKEQLIKIISQEIILRKEKDSLLSADDFFTLAFASEQALFKTARDLKLI